MKNKINKKAISPVIATILLITFTVVLAVLILQWGQNVFKNNTQEVSCECDGCHLFFINTDHKKGGDDKVYIDCCYDTSIDEYGQCLYLTQRAIINVSDYLVVTD